MYDYIYAFKTQLVQLYFYPCYIFGYFILLQLFLCILIYYYEEITMINKDIME